MHLNLFLPSNIEAGARRFTKWAKEVVETDGGYEVRNARWATPLRSWQVTFPNRKVDDVNFLKIVALWNSTHGGVDTFNFHDDIANETVKVRFDDDMQITHTAGQFYHTDTFTLLEVRG